jgi:hypothetical protein
MLVWGCGELVGGVLVLGSVWTYARDDGAHFDGVVKVGLVIVCFGGFAV